MSQSPEQLRDEAEQFITNGKDRLERYLSCPPPSLDELVSEALKNLEDSMRFKCYLNYDYYQQEYRDIPSPNGKSTEELHGQVDYWVTTTNGEAHHEFLMWKRLWDFESFLKHPTCAEDTIGDSTPAAASNSRFLSLPDEVLLAILEAVRDNDETKKQEWNWIYRMRAVPASDERWFMLEDSYDFEQNCRDRDSAEEVQRRAQPFYLTLHNTRLMCRKMYHLTLPLMWKKLDVNYISMARCHFLLDTIIPKYAHHFKSCALPDPHNNLNRGFTTSLFAFIFLSLPNIKGLEATLTDTENCPPSYTANSIPYNTLRQYFKIKPYPVLHIHDAIRLKGSSLTELRLQDHQISRDCSRSLAFKVIGACPNLVSLALEGNWFPHDFKHGLALGHAISSLSQLRNLQLKNVPVFKIFQNTEWASKLNRLELSFTAIYQEEEFAYEDLYSFLQPHAAFLQHLLLHGLPFTTNNHQELALPNLRTLSVLLYESHVEFLRNISHPRLQTLIIQRITEGIIAWDSILDSFIETAPQLSRLVIVNWEGIEEEEYYPQEWKIIRTFIGKYKHEIAFIQEKHPQTYEVR